MSNILIKLKEIAESNPNNIRILYNNCKEKDPFYSVFSGIPGHTDLLEHVQNYKHKFEEEAPPSYTTSSEPLYPTAPKMC